jgi:AraC-like DNA-binding protein
MIVWGPGFITTPHRHHCVQLVMMLDSGGSLLVRGGARGKWQRCGACLVRPDAIHEVDARAGPTLLGFVDAESELGVALGERIEGDIACVSRQQVARWRAALGTTPRATEVDQWVRTHLLRRRAAVTVDPRVQLVLSHLRDQIGTSADLSLNSLADVAGLSRSRFMHVFTASVGVPLRPYILWLRLQHAACELMHGTTVSSAAHHAGFADAAHLTRTFRRMLGTTPSDIALRTRLSRGVTAESS